MMEHISAGLDRYMNKLARTAMRNVLERHAEALTEVLRSVGAHLHESDVAALDDHLMAMKRMQKALEAEDVEE